MHGELWFGVTDTAELDAWLAENLLGWTEHTGYWWPPDESMSALEHAPKASTTGDGMLMVLEAMRERKWVSSAWIDEQGCHGDFDEWEATGSHARVTHRTAATLPLAVAQAARHAILSDHEE